MSLRFVCIELRKNLLCANVFLQFDQSLTETEFLKINVDEDAIRLREYSTETRVAVAEYFTIEARTMSNLTVEECNASFRLTVANIKDVRAKEKQQQNETENKMTPSLLPPSQQLPPAIKQDSATTVCCKNCECILASAQRFQRIREFPSGSIDMSEFFCHHGPDFGEVLVPHTNDLFYGFQFIVLNQQFLEKTTKEKETHLYCRRCLQYLGVTLFNGKAAKLWADTLQFQDASSEELCDIFSKTKITPTCQLLHKIIYESSVSDASETMLQQMHFTKVLLETTFPNRQRKYLLLHILEKQLQVLKNSNPLAHGSHNNNNVLQVQLQRFNSFKLLYRVLGETEDEGGGGVGGAGEAEIVKEHGKKVSTPSLLDIWQKDISILLLKVSSALFSNLLAELEDNSLLIPELYRYTQDHFHLSYVFYD